MPIPTSRTGENAQITVDEGLCNGCGLCVEICKDSSLQMVNGKARASGNPVFGCFGCGQCMAICPKDAISIEGRTLSPRDLFILPEKENAAGYDQLLSLLQRRRSVRDFKERPVEKEIIDKILDAASTAPMGIPPSDVHVMVMENREKVREFAMGFCRPLKR